MRILIVTADYLPNVSGIAKLTFEQTQELTRRGHEVQVLTTAASSENSFETGVHRCVTHLPPILRLPRLLREVYRTVKQFRPDFIWCTNYRGFAPPVMITALAYAIPYGLYYHGTEILTEFGHPVRQRILAVVTRKASLVCTNSNNSSQLLKRKYNLQSTVLRPGVRVPVASLTDNEIETFRESWLDSAKLPISSAKAFICVAACRLHRGKGISSAIRALSELPGEILQRVLYVVVGEGPHLAEFQSLVRQLGLTQHVLFPGSIPHTEIPHALGSANLYLQPSEPDGDFLESFGISYLEAQSMGIPCIGTDWGGIPEAVQNNVTGILVTPGSVNKLTNALIRLITDKELYNRMSVAGRIRTSDYLWEDHGQHLENLIMSAVEEYHTQAHLIR